MTFPRRVLATLTALALVFPFASRSHAATTNYSGTFAGDNTVVTIGFSTATAQQYTFSTTSFASGGFVPVLTLFSSTGGNPLGFGETDMGDVSFTQSLGPGSYLLALTESPNVFTTTYAAGTLFSSPTTTGDICGVSGGKFLDVVGGCTQRTGNYAVSINSVASTAVTPEPPTWLLVMPAMALLFFAKYSRASA